MTTSCPPFTPPTKRTMGQCSCLTATDYVGVDNAIQMLHSAYCPANYPLQPQPGGEPAPLDRLVRHVREAYVAEALDEWEERCLSLISEVREAHRKDAEALKADNAALLDRARRVLEEDSDDAWTALANCAAAPHPGQPLLDTLEGLKRGQQFNGEVRQTAVREWAEELAEMEPAHRDSAIKAVLERFGGVR